MQILGVRIDPLRRIELEAILAGFLVDGKSHLITTPNPEMLVAAHRDGTLRSILNTADLNLPDGVGLGLMARLYGETVPERVTGVDLVTELVRAAASHNRTVYLVGGRAHVADAAAKVLRSQVPQVQIFGFDSVAEWNSRTWVMDPNVAAHIRDVRPDILIITAGHGKQERWLAEHLGEFPSVKIAVGVGGALDFIAGIETRAPKALQRAGFEWLWRLLWEPKRFRRIMTAVVVFPWFVLRERLKLVAKS